MVKEGDIVHFFSSFAMWHNEYRNRNPGVVLEIPVHLNGRKSAVVLWANGEVTPEHAQYLRLAGKDYHDEK